MTPEPTISFWWDDHYTGISVCCWRYDDGRIVLYGAQQTERKARRAMGRDLRARVRLERRLARITARMPSPAEAPLLIDGFVLVDPTAPPRSRTSPASPPPTGATGGD